MDGWYPGGVKYRASYRANNMPFLHSVLWKVLVHFGHHIYGARFPDFPLQTLCFFNLNILIGFLEKSGVILCWFIIPVVGMTIPFLRPVLASFVSSILLGPRPILALAAMPHLTHTIIITIFLLLLSYCPLLKVLRPILALAAMPHLTHTIIITIFFLLLN